MKYTIITSSDEHMSDQVPIYRKDDYKSELMSILEYQCDLSKRVRADMIVRGGDFFHVKAANKTTMRTISDVINVHKSCSTDVYSIIGNHDMSSNDIDSIPGQPLGVLFSSGVFKKLDEKSVELGQSKLRIVGVDYSPLQDINSIKLKVSKKSDDDLVIAFVHAYASKSPTPAMEKYFSEPVFKYDDLVYDGCPDVYVFGHYHKDQGVTDVKGVKFVNLGSVARGSLELDDLDRKPKSSIIRINGSTIDIEEVVLPHLPASEVFDIERKEKLESMKESVDNFINEFMESMKKTNSFDKFSLYKEIDSFPSDVRLLLKETLEKAESGDV